MVPIWYFTDHIRVCLTHSLSERVFWKTADRPDLGTLKDGDYITFDQYVPEAGHDLVVLNRAVPKGTNRVVTFRKRIGCSSGETLSVRGEDYFCGDNYLGRAKRESMQGDRLIPFIFNGRVPEKMYFAMGDHPDSFDSRYVGFIARDRIKEKARGLF